jgi:16S rRNA G966 N2-methylase RsmD
MPSRALRALRRLGPRAFAGLLITNLKLLASGRYGEHRYAYDRSFDREHGVDTSGTVPPEEFDVPETSKSGAVRYEPVDPDFFDHVVERASITDRSARLFIDLGSGRGRGLLLAARAGFRKIMGVELDPLLDATARRNIDVFRHRHPEVEFRQVNGDATQFEFPAAPTVLFLNNPFEEPLVEKVLANAERSHEGESSDLVLLYLHSNHEQMIRSRAGWEHVESGTFRTRRQFFAVFRWRGTKKG